jgi:uncharacterized membrane protein YgcG
VDIVLGVSMTPTTVRMVLVEGERADGVTVDHDSFDITSNEGSANSAADQVVEAVLGTQESAATGGHHLKSIGVTWTDRSEASALRDALAAKGLDDVMLISAGHAAAALAQAVGRAVGYDTTALFFIDRDTATLSVVQTDDGSVVKVLSRSLHSDDAMAVLTEMAAAVDAQDAPPQGMFVVGSGVDVTSVKQHLQHLVSLPVNAPEEPELALARGAALAAASAPALEASTVGLAYSQDPDGTTAGTVAGLANAETQMAPVGSDGAFVDDYESLTDMQPVEGERKPFLLVGSALTSIFVVGVVALVISLAVSIRPTADQRPSPGESALSPSTAAPAAPAPAPVPVPEAQPIVEPPAPPAQTIKPPVPVVQEAPQAPRTVYVESPPPAQAVAPAPAPAAPAPAPAAPVPAPVPAAPVYTPPPAYTPPPLFYPRQQRPWQPSWLPPISAPQTPVYTPQTPTYSPPTPSWEQPEEPQLPQPQQPQTQNPQQVPSWQNGGGSNGSSRGGSDGSGSRGGSGFPGSPGRGGGGGGSNCFLIFCG